MPAKREPKVQFQWQGRKNGVSRWVGAPKGPPEWFCKLFLWYGAAAGTAGLAGLAYMGVHPEHWYAVLWLPAVGLTHAATFIPSGLMMRKMRRKLARLKSADELAEELGASSEAIQKLAQERNIRPEVNVNDADLYNPEEFYASRSLLRAATAPTSPDQLLRAAEPALSNSPAETLLRGADTEAAAASATLAGASEELAYASTKPDDPDQTVIGRQR